jgi:hypothetical protein
MMEAVSTSETCITGLELNYTWEETAVLGSRPAQIAYTFSSNLQKPAGFLQICLGVHSYSALA